MDLSTLATFDDLRRCEMVLTDGNADIEFLRFARYQEDCRLLWLNAVREAQRLQYELDKHLSGMADLETKLFHARKLLEMENKARREAENERDLLEKKLSQVSELVRNERDLKEETKDKFAFLSYCPKKRKSKLLEEKFGNEINSTGSFLSDLSLTQSEDDFLNIGPPRKWKKLRKSAQLQQQQQQHNGSFIGGKCSRVSTDGKRNSNRNSIDKFMEINATDKIVAHTRVSIPQGAGPIHAESTIQAIPQQQEFIPEKTPKRKSPAFKTREFVPSAPPPPPPQDTDSMELLRKQQKQSQPQQQQQKPKLPPKQQISSRQHTFISKTYMKFDTCIHCQKKIRFGSISLKCRDCRICVHPDCKYQLNMVCVPQSAGTPTAKGQMGIISDYTPSSGPMVPGILVHCVNEIETRGLNEVGIYRVPGSEREVKALKERFLKGKTLPHLSNIDVHVLCGCIKDFLRSLREPLIPTSLWKDFSNAVQNVNKDDSARELYIAINKLPQANRDTLAFLIQHLQRVANCPDVKMPIGNLAKVFGPTVVGYSSADPDQYAIFTETTIQAQVIEHLLNIQTDFWSGFLNIETFSNNEAERDYGGTPLRPQHLVGGTLRSTSRKERKFYGTPPYSVTKKNNGTWKTSNLTNYEM